jgi:hypothetical protein
MILIHKDDEFGSDRLWLKPQAYGITKPAKAGWGVVNLL